MSTLEHTPADNGKSVPSLVRPIRLDRVVLFALAVTIGAAIYGLLLFEPSGANFALIGLCGAVATACSVLRVGSNAVRLFCLGLTGCALGLGMAKIETLRAGTSIVEEGFGPGMIEGWITKVDRSASGQRTTLRVHAMSAWPQAAQPRLVRLTHRRDVGFSPGRFVRCYGVIRPPPAPQLPGDYNFRRSAWFQGLGGVGYVLGRCRAGSDATTGNMIADIQLRIASLQSRSAAYINKAAGERAGGLAAALMTGDRRYLDSADAEALRQAGLAHLLAISGLHMGLVCGVVYFSVRRGLALIEPLALRIPVQKLAAVAALVSAAGYLVLSGASVSTQRAFIMALILFGGVLCDRHAFSMRSLSIALLCVVVLSPHSVLSPGFQMSFAATGALIAGFAALERRRDQISELRPARLHREAVSLFLASLIGTFATAPIAMYHFGRVAPFGVVANLAAMPMVTFIAAPLAVLSAVAMPFGIAEPLLRLFGLSLEYVLWVAHLFDHSGTQANTAMPGESLIFFLLAITGLCVGHGRFRLFVIGTSIMALFLWFMAPRIDLHWSQNGNLYLRTPTGSYNGIAYANGEGLAPFAFAEVPINAACDEENICQFALGNGHITLWPPGEAPATCRNDESHWDFISTAPSTQCQNQMSWREVQPNGGFTLSSRPGRQTVGRLATCRPRPWQSCRRGS